MKNGKARRNGGPCRFRASGITRFYLRQKQIDVRILPAVLHQSRERAVVAPFGGRSEETGRELVMFPVKGDAGAAVSFALAGIGTGAFLGISATFHIFFLTTVLK
jgi:hypothetical protein